MNFNVITGPTLPVIRRYTEFRRSNILIINTSGPRSAEWNAKPKSTANAPAKATYAKANARGSVVINMWTAYQCQHDGIMYAIKANESSVMRRFDIAHDNLDGLRIRIKNSFYSIGWR